MNKEIELDIKQIFELQSFDKEKFEQWSDEEISSYVKSLRADLDYAGRRCSGCVALLKLSEKEIHKNLQYLNSQEYDNYIIQRWLSIIQTHNDVYEMIGYLILLKMDAITTSISLFQAQNDTERIMICKHAYTIIYEAIENNLFRKVAAGMKKYPEDLTGGDVFGQVWKEIRSVVKQMLDVEEAKEIRNSIDAHKCPSFATQVNVYKKCSWAQSVRNLYILVQIVDVIQKYMDIINKNMKNLYEQYQIDMKERLKQLEEIKKELQKL